jgi:RNA polymerase sigma factor (sigma-70 family)
VEQHAATSRFDETVASAESGALARIGHAAILADVATLPTRQREALVLRYYAELSEAEIAEAMGCSRGAVKSHTARGLAALRARMERWS